MDSSKSASLRMGGKQRTLALTLQQMFAVSAIIASSCMTATVLKRTALSSPTGGKLITFPHRSRCRGSFFVSSGIVVAMGIRLRNGPKD